MLLFYFQVFKRIQTFLILTAGGAGWIEDGWSTGRCFDWLLVLRQISFSFLNGILKWIYLDIFAGHAVQFNHFNILFTRHDRKPASVFIFVK